MCRPDIDNRQFRGIRSEIFKISSIAIEQFLKKPFRISPGRLFRIRHFAVEEQIDALLVQ